MNKPFQELKTLNNNIDEGSIKKGSKLITDTGVSFRDRVTHYDKYGRRIWVYPKKPAGKYHRWRVLVATLLLTIMVVLPFIKLNGKPFVLLDVLQRKFILFGAVFWPQDFHILALSFLALIIFIVLFTAIYGRIWCGWACPQTVFMEMVFRKIEYWIEGDYNKQRELNNAPMSMNKFWKKFAKHSIFISISFLVSNIILSYIVGIDKVYAMIYDGPFDHLGTFAAIVGNAGVFYFVYSWFREQACTYVCPYGRLQSVLIDKNTLVVAYDYKRGEPRAKFKKVQPENTGDCVDCAACVKVCPTGIDIRNGTQLECVNCTACMDACDDVMEKVNRPKGLIRYASINNIEEGTKFSFGARTTLYTVALILLLGVITYLLSTRSQVDANILKATGSTYQYTENNHIANLYTVTLINKSFEPLNLQLHLMDMKGTIKIIGKQDLNISPGGLLETTIIVELDRSEIKNTRNEINIGLYSGNKLIQKIKTGFTGPVPGMQ